MSVSDSAQVPGSVPAAALHNQSPILLLGTPCAENAFHCATMTAQVGKSVGRDSRNSLSPSTQVPDAGAAAVVAGGAPGNAAQRVTSKSSTPPGLPNGAHPSRSLDE